MAGSINGLGSGQQQIPLANTFQPGQNQDSRVDEQRKRNDANVQPRGAAAGQSQPSNASSARVQQNAAFKTGSQDNDKNANNKKRGTNVDITV